MPRIADLPWYDLPELRAATDAWWAGIAGHLRRLGVDGVPDRLSRRGSHIARWHDPQLLLSQACGYDVLYDQAHALRPVATPCYDVPGCEGPRYSSFVVVRGDAPHRSLADLRGARAAVNEAASHSGTNALRPLAAGHSRDGRFFGAVHVTGSHTQSLLSLLRGEVDVACIDAVVFGLMRDVRPQLPAAVQVVECTRPAPAPPYVTSTRTEPHVLAALRQALVAAVRDPALAAARSRLRIRDFTLLDGAEYRQLTEWERPALAAGYRELPAPRSSPLSQAPAAAPATIGASPQSSSSPRSSSSVMPSPNELPR